VEAGGRIEQDKHKTAAILRKWLQKDGGSIIALFPETPAGTHGQYVMSYEHLGHNGAANYGSVIVRTVLATKEEYRDLKCELEALGYNLEVCTRQTAKMREKCHRRAE